MCQASESAKTKTPESKFSRISVTYPHECGCIFFLLLLSLELHPHPPVYMLCVDKYCKNDSVVHPKHNKIATRACSSLREIRHKNLLLHSSAATGHTPQIGFLEQQGWPPTFLAWKEACFSRSEDSLSWVSSLDLALQWVSTHYSPLKQTSYAAAPVLTHSTQFC